MRSRPGFRGARALLMNAMRSSLPLLALLCLCLLSWTAAAEETDARPPAAIAPQGTRSHLPDARRRYAAGEPGRDLAHPRHLHQRRAARCDRHRLRLRAGLRQRKSRQRGGEGGRRYGLLKKFTLPGGAPVYIVAAKVTGVTRAIPQQHHPNAHAIIVSREGQTQVQETREAISEALAK